MKKHVFTVFTHMAVMAACICGLYSCAGDDEQQAVPSGESSVLEVTAGIHATGGILKAGPVAAFGEGSALGLFLTKGNPGDDYDFPATSRNVKSTFSGGVWTQAPAVNLYAHPATVYACYPYNQNNAASDGTSIPVGSGFTDHMYGTHTPGQQAINKDNRTVNLTMNHALALVQFELYKQDYPWTGDLTAIRITNAPGKAFVHMNGRMNVATGQITSLSGADMAIQLRSYTVFTVSNILHLNCPIRELGRIQHYLFTKKTIRYES